MEAEENLMDAESSRRTRQRRYYALNKERIAAARRLHYQRNKERIRELRRRYYADNRDRVLAKQRDYARAYYRAHREKWKLYAVVRRAKLAAAA
jgi:hypothetical protein